jgi:intein/homing endonuclease
MVDNDYDSTIKNVKNFDWSIFEKISNLNKDMASKIININFPENTFFDLIKSYPLYSLMIFSTIIILLFLFLMYLDYLKDSWKIPFAVVGDNIDILANFYPGLLDVIAAIYSIIVFYILIKDPEYYKKMATAAVFLENIIGIGFPIEQLTPIGKITNKLPTNTILMIISTLID